MNRKLVNRVLERAETLCRERGVRLTEQRKTVLRLLCAADNPISAYELLDRMRCVVKNPRRRRFTARWTSCSSRVWYTSSKASTPTWAARTRITRTRVSS